MCACVCACGVCACVRGVCMWCVCVCAWCMHVVCVRSCSLRYRVVVGSVAHSRVDGRSEHFLDCAPVQSETATSAANLPILVRKRHTSFSIHITVA